MAKQLDDLKLEMGEVERRAGLWEKEKNCLSKQVQAVQDRQEVNVESARRNKATRFHWIL